MGLAPSWPHKYRAKALRGCVQASPASPTPSGVCVQNPSRGAAQEEGGVAGRYGAGRWVVALFGRVTKKRAKVARAAGSSSLGAAVSGHALYGNYKATRN